MKTKRGFPLSVALALILSLLMLASCFGLGGRDDPPDNGTPSPPDLAGTFEAEDGSALTFGEDHGVTLSFTEELAGKTGFPAGESAGTYVFLFRNEEWRYDSAESFRLTVGDLSVTFPNRIGETGETTVAFTLPETGETVRFEKRIP